MTCYWSQLITLSVGWSLTLHSEIHQACLSLRRMSLQIRAHPPSSTCLSCICAPTLLHESSSVGRLISASWASPSTASLCSHTGAASWASEFVHGAVDSECSRICWPGALHQPSADSLFSSFPFFTFIFRGGIRTSLSAGTKLSFFFFSLSLNTISCFVFLMILIVVFCTLLRFKWMEWLPKFEALLANINHIVSIQEEMMFSRAINRGTAFVQVQALLLSQLFRTPSGSLLQVGPFSSH